MTSTPPGGGYQPGDYVPFKDRDATNPGAVAGQPGWGDQVAAAQAAAGPVDPYRAIYGFDAAERVALAGWGRRVLAYLFDTFLATVVGAPFFLGYWQVFSSLGTTTDVYGTETLALDDVPSTAVPLMVIGGVLYLAFFVYNWCIRQGRTGYTFGKTVVGIKLVGEKDRRPVGPGFSFLRQLAHVLDGLVCNLGYLWPIWDARKQTFADKIMGTLVIVQAQDEPGDPSRQ